MSSNSSPYFDETLEYWTGFWRDFGIKNPDFSGIAPFVAHPGYRPLILPKQELITPQYFFDFCHQFFGCWKWCDGSLDQVVTKNDRDPKNGAYVAWFRDRVESDEELVRKSAGRLKRLKIPGITLLEREIKEFDNFKRNGSHLDINSSTLCSGSRYIDDGVPCVHWSMDAMWVSWYYRYHHGYYTASRQLFDF